MFNGVRNGVALESFRHRPNRAEAADFGEFFRIMGILLNLATIVLTRLIFVYVWIGYVVSFALVKPWLACFILIVLLSCIWFPSCFFWFCSIQIQLSVALFSFLVRRLEGYSSYWFEPPAPIVVPKTWYELALECYPLVLCGLLVFVTLFGILYLLLKKVSKTTVEVNVTREPQAGFVPERMMRGSELITAPPPSFQVNVEKFEDGKWWHSGCAFRTEYGFFTAKHVVRAEKLRFTTATEAVEFTQDEIHELEMIDAVVVRVTVPGVSQAKMAKGALEEGLSLQAEISNGRQRSFGPLKASNVFGEIIYSGSTVAGFSGAPYYAGRFVYGMHVGASSVNFGYEASWLMTVARKEEDSDDFFLQKLYEGRCGGR